jgi:hypothetical protein
MNAMNKLDSLRSATLDEQSLLAVSGGWGRPHTYVDVDLGMDLRYDPATNTADVDLNVGVDIVTVQGRGNHVSPGDSWIFR